MTLTLKTYRIVIDSPGWTAIDITSRVEELVSSSNIRFGLATIFTPNKNTSITLTEYEPNLLSDIERLVEKLGGWSSIAEVIIGKGTSAPIVNGRLGLGAFKRIVFLDFSKEEGGKEVIVVVEGVYG